MSQIVDFEFEAVLESDDTRIPADSLSGVLILDPNEWEALLRERQESRLDRYDEVWDGIYVMSPLADNAHQEIGLRLAFAIHSALGDGSAVRIAPGANISNRRENWKKNYRVPDVVVFLPGNPAEDRRTHWLGGPDFAVEVISPRDRSRQKLDFYASVGVRALLIVDREPWALELYRSNGQRLEPVAVDPDGLLSSEVVPLRFGLLADDAPRRISAQHPTDGRRWTV